MYEDWFDDILDDFSVCIRCLLLGFQVTGGRARVCL